MRVETWENGGDLYVHVRVTHDNGITENAVIEHQALSISGLSRPGLQWYIQKVMVQGMSLAEALNYLNEQGGHNIEIQVDDMFNKMKYEVEYGS